MDITKSTKELIAQVQTLKAKYSDLASLTFIDFYCQCREGCDYLFPTSIRHNVRIMDILNWFFQCVETGSYTLLIKLMCQDIVGPTLAEFNQDQETENNLNKIFHSDSLKPSVLKWDCQRQPNGSVNLILRNLLQDLTVIEIKHQQKSSQS
jgi:hypothetical protein